MKENNSKNSLTVKEDFEVNADEIRYIFNKGEIIYASKDHLDYYIVLEDYDVYGPGFWIMCDKYQNGVLTHHRYNYITDSELDELRRKY